MPYKIVLSSGDKIPLDDFEEVKEVLAKMSKARRGAVILTRQGAFNPSHYVTIVPDKERWQKRAEYYQLNQKLPIEKPSEFAQLLAPKMKMLSDAQRAKAQEEASREERQLK